MTQADCYLDVHLRQACCDVWFLCRTVSLPGSMADGTAAQLKGLVCQELAVVSVLKCSASSRLCMLVLRKCSKKSPRYENNWKTRPQTRAPQNSSVYLRMQIECATPRTPASVIEMHHFHRGREEGRSPCSHINRQLHQPGLHHMLVGGDPGSTLRFRWCASCAARNCHPECPC